MGRNAKASSSKLPSRSEKQGRQGEKVPIPREPEFEAASASDDEEIDEDDLLEEVEDEEEEFVEEQDIAEVGNNLVVADDGDV